MIISFHNAHFFGNEHTVSLENLRIKLALSFIFVCRFIYYFFGRFSCERGVGDWNRLECILYLKICKIILNYLENVRFWICSILENKIGEITCEIPWMLIEPYLIMLISWIRFTCCFNATDKTGDMCLYATYNNILRYNMQQRMIGPLWQRHKNYATWWFCFFQCILYIDKFRQCNDDLLNFRSNTTLMFPIETSIAEFIDPLLDLKLA
jgi:hypothetical protein